MIPAQSTLLEIDNIPGEEIEFSIGDPRWVMRSTADLYSNREVAVVREYSTNAIDSHLEAGNKNPILVSLPTIMSPYFTVEDFGVGMSEQELKETYTKFGTSTKRESNDYNGMLGFGSKSAIAYTNTFTVTATKNGYRTIGIITRKPDYSVVLKVVVSSKTTAPNGVKVSVPVHNHADFAPKARDFYRFWFPGTVLIDGVEPVQAVGEKIDDNLYYSKNPGTSYVVMGNVSYRIANPGFLFKNSKMSNLSFVSFVNTCTCELVEGEHAAVEFTPSREDLKYTDHTKATLQRVITSFEDKMLAEAEAEINSSADHAEAFTTWKSWVDKLGFALFGNLNFRGDKLENNFAILGHSYKMGNSGYRYNTNTIREWEVDRMKSCLIVSDFTPTLSSHHKAKAREYLELKSMIFTFVLFTPDPFANKWVPNSRVVSWEDLKAALPKKVRKYGGPGSIGQLRIPKTFDYWTKDSRETEQELPSVGNLYYITPADTKGKALRTALTLMDDSGSIVLLARNRIAKFTRDNPHAKDFLEYAGTQVIWDGKSLLTAEGKRALGVGYLTRRWLGSLNTLKIDDPAWTETHTLINDKSEWLKEYNHNLELSTAIGRRWNFNTFDVAQNDESLINPYTLLGNLNSRYGFQKEHIYLYLNAAYAAGVTKGKK